MRTLTWLLVPVLLWVSPGRAEEKSCAQDTDCPEGFFCMPSACPAIACEDPAQCPPCPEGPGVCVEKKPVPGDAGWGTECETDADCPFAFACKEISVPCLDGVPCEEATARICVYQERTCEVDSDCGEGFRCESQEVCSGGCVCPGCACPPCPDGEECEPCDCDPEPCTCDSEPSCEIVGRICVLDRISCQDDGDCPEDWNCLVTRQEGCGCLPCACPDLPEEEGMPTPGEECTCEPCDCGETVETRECLPPGWNAVYRGGGATAQPETGGENQEPTRGGDGTGSDGTQGGPAAESPGDDVSRTSQGGCTIGGAGIATTLPLLLTLAGLALRRRRD